MKTKVVSISSHHPTESYYFLDKFVASLTKLGESPTILGENKPWRGLMTKARHLREYLRAGGEQTDMLIVCDAWDVLFSEYPQTLAERHLDLFGETVSFNAERSCFPRGDLADRFQDTGTPWRFMNCGFMIGRPEKILAILDSMNIDAIEDDTQRPDGSWWHPNDQEYFTLAFLEQPVPMVLDSRCELVQSLSGGDLSEFDFGARPMRNLATNTTPGAWHFNGNAKDILMPIVLKELGL